MAAMVGVGNNLPTHSKRSTVVRGTEATHRSSNNTDKADMVGTPSSRCPTEAGINRNNMDNKVMEARAVATSNSICNTLKDQQ